MELSFINMKFMFHITEVITSQNAENMKEENTHHPTPETVYGLCIAHYWEEQQEDRCPGSLPWHDSPLYRVVSSHVGYSGFP